MLFNINFKKCKTAALLTSVLILSLTLSGCAFFSITSSKDKPKPKISQQDQQKDYKRALRRLERKQYELALDEYNQFIVKYPFGSLSERARLERIFILNKLGGDAINEARASIDRFISQHPLHPDLDYAYYMRGVVLFEKKRGGIFARLAGAKEVLRTKNNYEESHLAFAELLQEFPESRYVPDAEKRMTYLRNNMAIFELSTANFYAERNAHIGAINRAEFIVKNYDQSPAVIDALKLMITSYEKIGLTDKADETRYLLASNYQGIQGIEGGNRLKPKKSRLRLPKLPNLNPLRLFRRNS